MTSQLGTLAGRLRVAAALLGVTYAEVADLVGTDAKTIGLWMRGDRQPENPTRLQPLAEKLGLPLAALTTGAGFPSIDTPEAPRAGVLAPSSEGRFPTVSTDRARGSPSSEPSLRAPHSDAAGAADVIAREIGQVIEAFIRMDEADGTKQGRAVIAEALEDFARCCRRLRPGVAVADLYEAALKLRRGEL